MKKYFLFLTVFLSTLAFAGERVIINPEQDQDIKIKVNDGGVVKDAISINGVTAQTTIGQSSGGVSPGLTILGDGSSTAVINRTTSVGALVGLEFQGGGTKSGRLLSNSSLALEIEASSASVGSVSQTGAWNLGNSAVTVQARPSHVLHFTGNTGSSNIIARNSTALANTESTEFQLQQGAGGANDRAGIGHYKDSGLTATAGYLMLREHDDGQQWLWVDSSGQFRIAASRSSIGTAGGTVVGTQTSDRRLKTNIREYEGGIDVVEKLKPSRFKFYDGKEHVGFIAQDVENVVPEAVVSPNDGNEYYRLEGRDLIPALVNAIKELNARVKELESCK